MQPINVITGVWQEGTTPHVVNLTGQAFYEEVGAHRFEVSAIAANGTALSLSGTVTAKFLRADGTTVALDGSISDGKATVTLVQDCYNVPGRYSIAIYVTTSGVSTCVYAACGIIFRTSSDTVIDSGATIPTLAQLEAAYAECVAATADATAAPYFVARPWNTDSGYINIESGNISISTGDNISNAKYARTVGYVNMSGFSAYRLKTAAPYEAAVFYYTGAAVADYTGQYHVYGSDYVVEPNPTYTHIRISFRRSDSATLTSDDLAAIPAGFKLCIATDTTLSIVGAPADADAVGYALNMRDSQALVNCSCANLFETGGISSTTGLDANASYVSLRTAVAIPRDTVSIKSVDSDYVFRLYLYGLAKANDYMGAWDGTQLITTISTTTLLAEVQNVQALFDAYPTCKYIRMVIVRVDSTSAATTDWSKVQIMVPRGNRFAGKLYAAIGDSITHGFIPRNAEGYNQGYILQSYAALATINLGMGFANHGVDSSCTGDYNNSVVAMVDRWNNVPSDADYISVMGGANDIRQSDFTLGTMASRDEKSYYGALHNIFSGLIQKFRITPVSPNPHVKIFGITPIKLLNQGASDTSGTGATLYDMEPLVQAMKDVCAYYDIPCLDMYHLCGITPEMFTTVHGTVSGFTDYYNPYITDGRHPTQPGAVMMGDILTGFLRSIS